MDYIKIKYIYVHEKVLNQINNIYIYMCVHVYYVCMYIQCEEKTILEYTNRSENVQ